MRKQMLLTAATLLLALSAGAKAQNIPAGAQALKAKEQKNVGQQKLGQNKAEKICKWTGVGIQIRVEGVQAKSRIKVEISAKHPLIIFGIIKNSPAARSGLSVGDQIVKVDGKSVDGKGLDVVAYQIRGAANTPVALTVKKAAAPNKTAAEQTITIRRAQLAEK